MHLNVVIRTSGPAVLRLMTYLAALRNKEQGDQVPGNFRTGLEKYM